MNSINQVPVSQPERVTRPKILINVVGHGFSLKKNFKQAFKFQNKYIGSRQTGGATVPRWEHRILLTDLPRQKLPAPTRTMLWNYHLAMAFYPAKSLGAQGVMKCKNQ